MSRFEMSEAFEKGIGKKLDDSFSPRDPVGELRELVESQKASAGKEDKSLGLPKLDLFGGHDSWSMSNFEKEKEKDGGKKIVRPEELKLDPLGVASNAEQKIRGASQAVGPETATQAVGPESPSQAVGPESPVQAVGPERASRESATMANQHRFGI